jgi:hypothetical protein
MIGRHLRLRVFSNDWMVVIVGGLVSAVLSAYALGWLGFGAGGSPRNLPEQSHAEQLSIDITPGSVVSKTRQPVALSVRGASINGTLSISVYAPSGSTVLASSMRVEESPTTTIPFDWPPAGWTNPATGVWKVAAFDAVTGSSAVAYLRVLPAS